MCAPGGGHTGTSHHRRPVGHRRCGADGEKLIRRSHAYTQLKGPEERQGAQTNTHCLLQARNRPAQPTPAATTSHHHPGGRGCGGGKLSPCVLGLPLPCWRPGHGSPAAYPTGRLPGALVGRKGRGCLSGSREQAWPLARTAHLRGRGWASSPGGTGATQMARCPGPGGAGLPCLPAWHMPQKLFGSHDSPSQAPVALVMDPKKGPAKVTTCPTASGLRALLPACKPQAPGHLGGLQTPATLEGGSPVDCLVANDPPADSRRSLHAM